MQEKTYSISINGNGYRPHILHNANDPSDKVALCSCGGTSDPNGRCDGTHNKKSSEKCSCRYCKTLDEKQSTE